MKIITIFLWCLVIWLMIPSCEDEIKTIKDSNGWVYHTKDGSTTWHKIESPCTIADICPPQNDFKELK